MKCRFATAFAVATSMLVATAASAQSGPAPERRAAGATPAESRPMPAMTGGAAIAATMPASQMAGMHSRMAMPGMMLGPSPMAMGEAPRPQAATSAKAAPPSAPRLEK
jgi:hypothetical protein